MELELILNNPKGYANSRVFKKNWPEDYMQVVKCYGNTFAEQLYNYIHPNELHVCPVCGGHTKFRSLIAGYSETCSIKCATKNPNRVDKIKSTCKKKYGVDNPKQFNKFKEKAKSTCMKKYGTTNFIGKNKDKIIKKYGVDNISKLDSIKVKKQHTMLKNWGTTNMLKLPKTQATMLSRYGTIYALQNDKIKNKAQNTILGKYGVDNVFKSKEIQELIKSKMLERYGVEYPVQNPNIKDKVLRTIQERYGVKNTFQLANIQQYWKSSQEDLICSWLNDVNVKYETSNRKILHGKELDIYIPKKKIAIEFNGVYWHSTAIKSKKYHVDKYKECELHGIQLISIWEDWIINTPWKCKSLILSKLGIYDTRLFARKCKLKTITSKQANELYNKYHIHGKCMAKIHYGLFYKDELLSAMSFIKFRKGDGWKLVRYCCKGGVQIMGGARKMFTHFINDYNASLIHACSSNDISNGNLYKTLGFKPPKTINASYWYIGHDLKRYSRYSFNKVVLQKKVIDAKGKTGSQIMNDLPYHKIYDSGTRIWVWKRESL